jgi:type IV pilus assembly protein PilQ
LLVLTVTACSGAAGRASLPVESAPDQASAGEIVVAAELNSTALSAPQVTVLKEVRVADVGPVDNQVRIEIRASNSFNYTSYEPEPERLIIEIPNVDLASLPSEVRIDEAGVVMARIEAVPSHGGGSHARIEFVGEFPLRAQVNPRGAVLDVSLATAPAGGLIGDIERVPAAPEPAALVVEPKPAALPATEVTGVVVADLKPGSATIGVLGDGSLTHNSFVLRNPDRLVLDLKGVVNGVSEKRVEIGSPPVERVRIAQFRIRPEKIVRVVVDLTNPTEYEVVEGELGLNLLVGESARAAHAGTPEPAAVGKVQVASARNPQQPPAPVEPVSLDDIPADLPAAPPAAADAREERIPAPPAAVPEPARPAGAVSEPPAETIPELPEVPARLVPSSPLDLGKDVVLFDRSDPEAAPTGGLSGVVVPAGTTFESQTIAGERTRYRGERISITFRDADIREVFFFFADVMDMNIVLDPDVTGTIDIRLVQVPFDQAFHVVLKNQGLDAIEEDRVIRVARTQKLRAEAAERRALKQAQEQEVDPVIFTRRLSYAQVQEASALLQQVKSDRGKIIADIRTNTLVISDIPQKREEYENLLRALDTQTPQVSIEARIVEAIRDFERSLGIDWGFTGLATPALGTQTNLTFPHRAEFQADVNLSSTSQAGTLGLALGNVLDSVTLDIQLDAFEADGKVRILSAPKVVTQNNQPATIEQGTQIPVVTTTATEIEVQYVPASLRLIVTPQITAEQTVIMKVVVENNQPSETLSVGDTPGIVTERVDTQILVRSGTTAVIGGVYKLSEAENETGIPGLRRIPFFGWLFKNKSFIKNSSELLVFLTPRIITNV